MNINRKLGEYFTLREFLRSETASRMGKEIEQPPEAVVLELQRLVTILLDPLRERAGRPIMIISGWRPLWLNKAVGGSKFSDHLTGNAADFRIAGMTDMKVALLIKQMRLPLKQCILEFPPGGWIHLSVPQLGIPPKREFLTALKENGKTVYHKGI